MIARRGDSAASLGASRHSPYMHLLAVALVIVAAAGWAATNAAGRHTSQEMQTYFSAYMRGETAMRALADCWQQRITKNRLTAIGMTGMALFLLAGLC